MHGTRRGGGNYGSPASSVGQRRPGAASRAMPAPTQHPLPHKPFVPSSQQPKQNIQQIVQEPKIPPPVEKPVEQKPEPKEEIMEISPVNESTENGAKPKPHWMKGKISKAEKVKRRNRRLKKILQPKNALMIINEIVGNVTYDVSEEQTPFNLGGVGSVGFKATVAVDGQVHEGCGKNKLAAKTAAAESAIKHLVLTKLSQPETKEAVDNDGDEKMEPEESQQEEDVSYCHLASFALFKLFSTWDEGGKILSRSTSQTNLASEIKSPSELRPSKKMPESPELMNPVMLLNQMYPGAVYEEVCKTGVPPKVVFTMKCSINGQSFIGNGSNKKAARKDAAFQACKVLLQVQYPENE